MGQLRTQNLQQQNAALQLQQQQLELKSNQAMMKAFAQGNGNWDDTQKLLDSSPDILPQHRMAVEQHRLQLQTSAAALTKDQQGIYQTNVDRYRGELEGVTNQDELNQANLNAARAGVSFADPSAPGGSSTGVPQLTTFTDVPHVKAFSNSLALHTQLNEEALKQAQAGEAAATAGQRTAEAAKANIETQLAQHKIDLYNILQKNPQALGQRVDASVPQAKYPTLYSIALNEARNQPDIDKLNESVSKWAGIVADIEKEKDPVLRRQKIEDAITKETDPRVIRATLAKSPELNLGVPGLGGGPNAPGGPASITPSTLHGDAYLQSLQPNAAATIKAIADGRETLDIVGRNQVARQQLQQAVMQYDPSWSEQRAALRGAFTTGPEAANIGNLNTGTVHAQQFLEAAQAMQNFTFRPGNAAWNAMSRLFGSAIPTNLEAIKNAWAGEMASALKGTATDPEIASIKKGIDDVNSWDQFQGVVNENLKALGAKLNTYHERAQRTGVGEWSPILPSAREVFRQHGMDPTGAGGTGGGKPVKGDTKTYQGHTYQFDGTKWVRQ